MQDYPTLKKHRANSVPYGEQITRRGGYVWAAYDGDRLICVNATAKEARLNYYRIRIGDAYGRAVPQYLNSHRERPQHIKEDDLEAMGLTERGHN